MNSEMQASKEQPPAAEGPSLCKAPVRSKLAEAGHLVAGLGEGDKRSRNTGTSPDGPKAAGVSESTQMKNLGESNKHGGSNTRR